MCARIVHLGKDRTVITARGMDWMEDIRSNLWLFPRGMKRSGLGGANTIDWTSRYGSVVTTAYDIGSADGLNERGLVAHMLYLVESDYGREDGRPVMSISLWVRYVLDNFSTVADAVADSCQDRFRIAAPALPNGKASTVHLSLSRPHGGFGNGRVR